MQDLRTSVIILNDIQLNPSFSLFLKCALECVCLLKYNYDYIMTTGNKMLCLFTLLKSAVHEIVQKYNTTNGIILLGFVTIKKKVFTVL